MVEERKRKMYQNIFKREEQKYLLTRFQYNQLMRKTKKYLHKDSFYESTICNIYFDTEQSDLIIHSLEKPIFKEKVRLRSYGVPTFNSSVFLEIKDKYKGIVGKRRVKLLLKDFYGYLEKGKLCETQIMKEIDYFFKYFHLKPKIFIAYDRKSYYSKEDTNFRITFDENLRSRKEDLRLEIGDAGKKFFEEDKIIMEVKTLHALPLWFVHVLSELKIYPHSFSKYGSIYEKERKDYVK